MGGLSWPNSQKTSPLIHLTMKLSSKFCLMLVINKVYIMSFLIKFRSRNQSNVSLEIIRTESKDKNLELRRV